MRTEHQTPGSKAQIHKHKIIYEKSKVELNDMQFNQLSQSKAHDYNCILMCVLNAASVLYQYKLNTFQC